MSPSTATAGRRRTARRPSNRGRPPARRSSAARRRRTTLLLIVLTATVVGVVLAMPLFRKAVNEFTLPLSYANVIRQQAGEKHLDPALVAAVIYAESKFDPRTSSAGAVGLMQIEPQTARFLAHRSGGFMFKTSDLWIPQVNIAYGSYYLRYLLDRYRGDKVLALAAYNGGESNVDRWVGQAHAAGHRLTVSRIPFPETRDYVRKVLTEQRNYRHTYASELGYG